MWDEARLVLDGEIGEEKTIDGYDMALSLKSGVGRFRFKRLSEIAKHVLVIIHSNAGEERVLSLVKIIRPLFILI